METETCIEVVQPEDLLNAANHLATSSRGRHAMKALLAWLDADGVGLDVVNQECVLTLLYGAFGRYTSTARDAMRDALEAQC